MVAECQAALAGHHDIADDQVWRILFQESERTLCGIAAPDFVPGLQQRLEVERDVRVIVDHENGGFEQIRRVLGRTIGGGAGFGENVFSCRLGCAGFPIIDFFRAESVFIDGDTQGEADTFAVFLVPASQGPVVQAGQFPGIVQSHAGADGLATFAPDLVEPLEDGFKPLFGDG